MAILTFPNVIAQKISWGLSANTRVFESPLNRSTQTVEAPGARWFATLNFNTLNDSDATTMRVFLTQLRGMSGRFYLYDHSRQTPLGNPSGSPTVSGALQTGNSLVTAGWPASTTGLLLPGDYIGINNGQELKLVTQQVDSDASGNATIIFEPPIRNSPGDGTAIVYNKPTCIMRLSSDDASIWSVTPSGLHSLSVSCVEAFYL